jgi:small-conductance mechanosensitive channel
MTRVRISRQQRSRVRDLVGLRLKWALVCVALLPCAGAQDQAPPDTTPTQIIQFLSQTVDWYRQTQQEQHLASEPGELGFLTDNRRTAAQIVRLAFDFARQREEELAKRARTTSSNPSNATSQYQTLSNSAASADQLVQQTQAELDSMKQQLERAPASKRKGLQDQIAETQSELALFEARQQALHGMLDFANSASAGSGATTLKAQIEELAHAVPASISGVATSETVPLNEQQQSAKSADVGSKASPSGMWALAADIFRLSGKRSSLSNELRSTEALQQISGRLRAPLVNHLKQLIQSGNQLAQEADTSEPGRLLQEKQQLDALTTQFKQVASAVTGLAKQNILLDLYKNSLNNWRAEIGVEVRERLKSLLVRILGLLIALGVVLIVGEVWRRAIFRYVHDPRRRYQFLLMRRIVLWIAIAMVLIFAFVTEIGAVATFAGLITAGVAVALQNVIVSIVGYFFLIGKYGIRVGDRVQVGSVSGEVVDIGLVRFHLLEMSDGATDAEPTGRVVAFSNSVVFQSTAGLFKHLPGINFSWREIILKFAADTDFHAMRDRLHQAIDKAYADYRDSFDLQRRRMEMTLSSISAAELKPRLRIQFTTSAIEVLVRFPVVTDKAGEIDERIISEIFAAIAHEPKLKLLNAELAASKTAT